MDDWFEVPIKAIHAFEKVTKLSVTVHEMTGALWAFVPPERFNHVNAPCVAAKAIRMDSCVKFDVLQTRAAMAEKPEGRVHVCHAGLVEWAVPTINNGRLQRLFFAGQRRPGNNLTCAQSQKIEVHPSWANHLQHLEPVDDEEAAWILESLRQLAARIELWRLNPPQGGIDELPDGVPSRGSNAKMLNRHLIPRQHIIRYYIQSHHTKPITLANLAERLHLSESRAGHAVKQACGQSFVDMLTHARLRTAAGLLRHTDLPVSEVALASGFRNSSHFHFTFRKEFGTTPLRYRSEAEISADPAAHKTDDKPTEKPTEKTVSLKVRKG